MILKLTKVCMIKNKKNTIIVVLGFIGTHLIKELLKYSNTIYLIDNFSTRKKSKIEYMSSNESN